MFRKYFISTLTFIFLISCSDIDDIKGKIKSYEDRLASIESAIENINNNTIAISALHKNNITISSFDNKVDNRGKTIGYRLKLSDGQEVDVTFGNMLDKIVPIIGIDSDGNFIYSIDNGQNFSIIEESSNAYGKEGMTPKVKLDSEGYWIISFDNGKNWERMNDINGLGVNAFKASSSTGNSFFKNIVFDKDNSIMHFSLVNGYNLDIRVTQDTKFTIYHYTDGDTICLGEEVKYLVSFDNLKDAFFNVPNGWRATLDNDSMVIFGPTTGTAGKYDIILTLVSLNGLINTKTFSFTLNPIPAEPKWRLDWEEEFNQYKLNTKYWDYVPRAKTTAKRYMSKDPRCYEFRDGCLVLKSILNDNLQIDTAKYLTGAVYTKKLKEFKPGRIEVRAKIKPVQGMQPAIWTGSWIGTTWPWGGEIDIMEQYNTSQKIYQTVHSHYTYDLGFDKDPVNQVPVPLNPAEFHTYGVETLENELNFYVDGVKTLTYPKISTTEEGQFPFYSSVYLMLDMQIIGSWGGKVDESNLPGEIEIDWVRHYIWK